MPHRLVPYESHSRTWFVHYLPRPVSRVVYSWLGRDAEEFHSRVFLRAPWMHRRMARRYIGPLEDLTVERFRGLTELDAYDGPEGLRRLLGRLVHLPLAGPLTGLFLKNFVMLDIFAVKRPRA